MKSQNMKLLKDCYLREMRLVEMSKECQMVTNGGCSTASLGHIILCF
ncbi:MAG TPA: hypothetical protein VJY54_03990 [Lachnospiraceae bacterium]|nr:hypothetical protein [Lachnospiraceae bacterium]